MVQTSAIDRPYGLSSANPPFVPKHFDASERTRATALRLPAVLLVEDEYLLRETTAEGLRDMGFSVCEARDGEQALAILRSMGSEFDWLFTDIRLPGTINGWHVAFEFRFIHPLRPVVYATGWSEDIPPTVAGSLFFRKPYDLELIVGALHSLSSGA